MRSLAVALFVLLVTAAPARAGVVSETLTGPRLITVPAGIVSVAGTQPI